MKLDKEPGYKQDINDIHFTPLNSGASQKPAITNNINVIESETIIRRIEQLIYAALDPKNRQIFEWPVTINVVDPLLRQKLGDLTIITKNKDLLEYENVLKRMKAVKDIDQILREFTPSVSGEFPDNIESLRELALIERNKLLSIQNEYSWIIKNGLKGGRYSPENLRKILDQHYEFEGGTDFHILERYDYLDGLIEYIFDFESAPEIVKNRSEEIFDWEPLPTRGVLEMIDLVKFKPSDVFYDIGSGMGQIPMLVNMLCGIQTVGIEIQEEYCRFAKSIADSYNLKNVEFRRTDAQFAEFTDGTVFFLYTPFLGQVLKNVLGKLKAHSEVSSIQIVSVGPITKYLEEEESWLMIEDKSMNDNYRIALFNSTPNVK